MTLSLESVIGFINATLAPAVVFTGVGLLLAGLQAKYSTIVQVIRQLNAERRDLRQGSVEDQARQDNLTMVSSQIGSLMTRAKLVRNAICALYLTIFFLVLSSILMGLSALAIQAPTWTILAAFAAALVGLFFAIGSATREALLSYHIIQLEVRRWL
jgi:hypothetical protein